MKAKFKFLSPVTMVLVATLLFCTNKLLAQKDQFLCPHGNHIGQCPICIREERQEKAAQQERERQEKAAQLERERQAQAAEQERQHKEWLAKQRAEEEANKAKQAAYWAEQKAEQDARDAARKAKQDAQNAILAQQRADQDAKAKEQSKVFWDNLNNKSKEVAREKFSGIGANGLLAGVAPVPGTVKELAINKATKIFYGEAGLEATEDIPKDVPGGGLQEYAGTLADSADPSGYNPVANTGAKYVTQVGKQVVNAINTPNAAVAPSSPDTPGAGGYFGRQTPSASPVRSHFDGYLPPLDPSPSTPTPMSASKPGVIRDFVPDSPKSAAAPWYRMDWTDNGTNANPKAVSSPSPASVQNPRDLFH